MMLFAVVAGSGSGLVFSPPGRPGQDVGDRVQWPQQQGDEESAEFVDCQGDSDSARVEPDASVRR